MKSESRVRAGTYLPILHFALFFTMLVGLTNAARSAVRISFLDDKAALDETVSILRTVGCSEDSVTFFREMVERYHGTYLSFDRGRFPTPTNGFYLFATVSELIAALPHQLSETEHTYEINCFDTAIALANTQLRVSVKADDLAGPFLAPYSPTNGTLFIRPAATARDAYAYASSARYRDLTGSLIPESLSQNRIVLNAALFSCHLIPEFTSEKELPQTTLAALKNSWSRVGLMFPSGFEMVLCHEIHFPQKWLVTAHAGLLFARKEGFTYFEKPGGKGPFVRLDINNKSELLAWLGAMFRGAERFGYTHHFVTFNATALEPLANR